LQRTAKFYALGGEYVTNHAPPSYTDNETIPEWRWRDETTEKNSRDSNNDTGTDNYSFNDPAHRILVVCIWCGSDSRRDMYDEAIARCDMKIVVVRSPKAVAGVLKVLFKIK